MRRHARGMPATPHRPATDGREWLAFTESHSPRVMPPCERASACYAGLFAQIGNADTAACYAQQGDRCPRYAAL